MPSFESQLESFSFADRAAWRDWLAQNHDKSSGIWLVYYKRGSKTPSVAYAEVVKEALCFGWIDSKVQAIDKEKYRQVLTPRKPKSVWSKLNKTYIEELEAAGLMTEAGRAKIEAAKLDGSWTSLDSVEAMEVPTDLQQALDANLIARTTWESLRNSQRKMVLYRLSDAKRPETRRRRLDSAMEKLSLGENPVS
jgi:uncharacterized protein YdeI (YjbR/CyaY-like superfamily)